MLFHIALESAWVAARASGRYAGPGDVVHAAYEDQVDGVYQRFFADSTERLVLLAIDPERLLARVEDVTDAATGQDFPHILGPVNRDAVVAVSPMPPQAADDHFPPVRPVERTEADAGARRRQLAVALLVLLVGLALGVLLGMALLG